jgi:hypothetical protein
MALTRAFQYLLIPSTTRTWDELDSYRRVGILEALIRLSQTAYVNRSVIESIEVVSDNVGYQIFVSYGGCDAQFAKRLSDDLRKNGFDLWFAEWNLDFGDDFVQNINDGIKTARFFLPILSPESIERYWVRFEQKLARAEGKRTIPVLYKPCMLPDELKTIKYVDFTASDGYESSLRKLVETLRPRVSYSESGA